ncbi:MAG: diguanylate cyclase [Gemmatimonadetes bacterium]|nr:diguanylate cyclase [Gemmatimonadota bacterium]NNF14736.1 diguanylate cyclase [Gemmatimonadota bacterium]
MTPSGFGSIRAKILLLATAATLVPAVSTAALSYVRARAALTETLEGELQGIGAQTARELDLWLKERQYDLRVFVGSFEVIENLERASAAPDGQAAARVSDYLSVLQQRFPEYAGLLVVDDRGELVAEGAGAVHPREMEGEWLDGLARGESHVGDPYRHTTLGAVATTLAVPIQDPQGGFPGGLVATLTFDGLGELLGELAPPDGGSIEVLGPEGRVVVSSEGGTPFETVLGADARAQLEAADGGTVEYADQAGQAMVGTLTLLAGTEWSVLSHLPTRRAYAQVSDLTRSTVLLVAVLLLFVGSAAWGIGLLITRPLARLTEAAGAVSQGDLSVRLPVTGRDEVSYLTEVFNSMVTRLDGAASTLQAQNDELDQLARTDALTTLYNRRHVLEVLKLEVSRAGRYKRHVGVLMLDVDKFKHYNDTYGHQAGDEVLEGMGEVLRDATRDTDIPARYGGEEFIVVLPDTDLSGAVEAGERIRERLAREVFDGGKVTVSIGAAEFPAQGPEPGDVIAAADLALYAAKEAGRDRVLPAEPKQPVDGA